MPTYVNNREALLYVDVRHNYRTSMVQSQTIEPKAVFVARTTDIPARWLEQGDTLAGNQPWVTMLFPEPTDEEINGSG